MTDTAELSMQDMMNLQERIQKARNGEGEMPSREELLQCFTQLRRGRAAGAAKAGAKKKAAAVTLPTDLNDLFNTPI